MELASGLPFCAGKLLQAIMKMKKKQLIFTNFIISTMFGEFFKKLTEEQWLSKTLEFDKLDGS